MLEMRTQSRVCKLRVREKMSILENLASFHETSQRLSSLEHDAHTTKCRVDHGNALLFVTTPTAQRTLD
jgi:hypothetical protein